MRNVRLLMLVTAMALWPGAAHAAGFWSWLEELSGPGPFTGYMFSVPLTCFEEGRRIACWERDIDGGQTLVAKFGRFSSGDRPRFQDLPANDPDNLGAVHVIPISGVYLFRLHRTFDVGPGAGIMRFSGDGFDALYRFTLTPVSASVRPLLAFSRNRWARLLRIEVDTSFVTKGFTGADFGNTRTGFRSGPEFLTRAGIILDFGDVFYGN